MSEYYELSKALLEWDGVKPMTPINWEAGISLSSDAVTS